MNAVAIYIEMEAAASPPERAVEVSSIFGLRPWSIDLVVSTLNDCHIDPGCGMLYDGPSEIPKGEGRLKFHIELEREDDGRWIAEIASLPGVMVYGRTKQEAVAKVKALALRVLADVALLSPVFFLPLAGMQF